MLDRSVSEFLVFIVLLVSTVLQTNGNDFSHEAISIHDYGTVLMLLTLIIIPITVFFVIDNIKSMQDLNREFTHGENSLRADDDNLVFNNPMTESSRDGADPEDEQDARAKLGEKIAAAPTKDPVDPQRPPGGSTEPTL
jgi:hypothetical protein